MIEFTPLGTATQSFFDELGEARDSPGRPPTQPLRPTDPDDFESAYLGWEIARCVPGLAAREGRALAALAAACIAALRAGSTRLPLEGSAFATALASVGAEDVIADSRALVAKIGSAGEGEAINRVLGRPGQRKPLIVEGAWLYTERMRALEERFCARVRERIARKIEPLDARAVGRAIAAVAAAANPLTNEQRRAVRAALGASLALITGGPGTGKTTAVVAMLRALAWMGAPMASVAIAAPTGKAAQRLSEAIAHGLESKTLDIADAGLRANAPSPQTLHRLLGWSPVTGRFAHHQNDPLPHAIVVVDEASMIDLALMDRLFSSLRTDSQLVLLGDADQLPSVEAGAVFRDLCAALGAVRLTSNMRVARDPSARPIVAAAEAVNAGSGGAKLADMIAVRRSMDDVRFEGVEFLAAAWSDVGEAFLARWWRDRVATDEGLAARASRIYRLRGGVFEADDRGALRALFEHHTRSRLLCVTRVRGFPTSAETINDRLFVRMRSSASGGRGSPAAPEFALGMPVIVQRNDYERGLFNGDQGLIVRAETGDAADGGRTQKMAMFRRGESFEAVPLDVIPDLAPAYALTVHRAQGSEFDDVALLLPDRDLPLLTRELMYTAMTRARRSVLVVGDWDLFVRAVSRTVERHSGVGERLSRA